MNIINRAFQQFTNANNRFLSQEPRVRFAQMLQGMGALISASAFTQHQGALDFLGLQGLAITMEAAGAYIENPHALVEGIERLGMALALSTHWI